MATIYYNADIEIDTDDVIQKITTKELVEELHIRWEYDNDARNAIEKLVRTLFATM